MEERQVYQKLYSELEGYEHRGVGIRLESHPASPMQIVTAHMVEEECLYMRDYVWDEGGAMKAIEFHNIRTS